MSSSASEPRVSVVIPAYNTASFLADALDSVYAQSHRPFEVIVVDDGSTDSTRQVALAHPGKPRLIRQSNRGANHARNQGLYRASGEYVLFLDADDFLSPDAIEVLLDSMDGADVAYGDVAKVDAAGRNPVHRGQHCRFSDPVCSVIACAPQPGSALVRRSVAAGCPWREEYGFNDEFRFFVRLALEGAQFRHTAHTMAFIRQHRSSSRKANQSNPHAAGILTSLVEFQSVLKERRQLTPLRSAYLNLALVQTLSQGLSVRRGSRELFTQFRSSISFGEILRPAELSAIVRERGVLFPLRIVARYTVRITLWRLVRGVRALTGSAG